MGLFEKNHVLQHVNLPQCVAVFLGFIIQTRLKLDLGMNRYDLSIANRQPNELAC